MIEQRRQDVVREARSWVKTPYHHMGDIKGVGVDCAMLLVRVYCDLGVITPKVDPRPYPAQWFLHRDEEKYLGWVAKYNKHISPEQVQPGDIAVYKFGRCAAHGAIIVDDELMIHAYLPAGCVETIERRAPLIHGTLHSFWSPFT